MEDYDNWVDRQFAESYNEDDPLISEIMFGTNQDGKGSGCTVLRDE